MSLSARSAPPRSVAWARFFSCTCPQGPGESSTPLPAPTITLAVPELPDLAVVTDALQAALAGRTVAAAQTMAPLAVRGTPAELAALLGQRLLGVARRGKFVWLELDRDRLAINPMLTGRIQLARADQKRPSATALVLAFGPRDGPPADAAAWTRGAAWLPPDGEAAELRYRDPTQMGKVYLLPAGISRAVPGAGEDEQGPDADDPAFTLTAWRSRIRRHPGELKNLLRNQAFVAGIGNAYSDEILHAARLLPYRKRTSLAPEEVDELYAATRSVLANAVAVLRVRVPPTFETQVRDFLAVHGKGGSLCPRCSARLTEVTAGGSATTFCRGCQR